MTTVADQRRTLARYTPPTRLSSLSVVMPAYNEAANIESAVRDALKAAADVSDLYEVIVVDDGSVDETRTIVESLAENSDGCVRLVRNHSNLGYGPTVRRAWRAARMEWILFTDSDCQFEFDDVKHLIAETDEADIVTGWRRHRQDPLIRRVNAGLFNLAGRCVFGTHVRDVDCAFKLMRTSAMRGLALESDSAMVNTELLYQARQQGLGVTELPVRHKPRRFGVATGGDPRVIARAVREFVSMRRRFNRSPDECLNAYSWSVACCAMLLGSLSVLWALNHNVILAYGDAEAHLNISKRVVSGLTPGLSQLGSVWLPLPHVLMAPFVVSDVFWRTGLAGAILGVPSLVLAAVMVYRLAYLLTSNFRASLLAPAVIVLNPNVLYLAATPMTEVLLLGLMTASVYNLARWITRGDLSSLVLAGILGALATLTRYDAWLLVALEAALVAVLSARRLRTWHATEGLTTLFSVLAFAGIAGWFLWNLLIFSNPLYFSQSVYGSAEQQKFFLRTGLLPTYHDLGKSVVYWLEDVRLIAGLGTASLAGAGVLVAAVHAIRTRRVDLFLIATLTASCFLFYVLTLYVGQASLILPRFVDSGSPYQMSNLRYGVQALFPLGIFLAFLATVRSRIVVPLLAAAILIQSVAWMSSSSVMAYEDGIRGLSSQRLSKGPAAPVLEAWMRRHYDEGLVLMDDYRTPISPVQSGVPMDRFIGVGNKPYWSDSLNNPGKYATWIVLQQAETDAVWSGFSRTSQRILEDHFVEVYRAGTRHVYKRRPAAPGVVQKRGQHLVVDDRRWNPVGANSYDLLEQPQAVIDARLEAMAGRGLNSVRTWCFDNDGGLREETLSKLSSTLMSAQEVGIKVVCTLANNLSDFGGPQYFTPPGEDFYTSELARSRYLRQVQRLLEYKDANGRRLADSPAILAWDLMNEPRPSVASSSSAVRDWAEAAAHFVGGIDQLHLITIGAEGFSTGYPVDQRLAASPPIDFADVCGVPGITLCQAHLFAKYLNHPYSSKELGQIMQAWRTSADAINKPLMMGEVGYSLSDGSNSEALRVVFLDNVARAITNSDIDGAMIWNLGAEADRQFTISLNDPMSRRLIGSWATKILRLPVPSRAPGGESSSLPRTKQ